MGKIRYASLCLTAIAVLASGSAGAQKYMARENLVMPASTAPASPAPGTCGTMTEYVWNTVRDRPTRQTYDIKSPEQAAAWCSRQLTKGNPAVCLWYRYNSTAYHVQGGGLGPSPSGDGYFGTTCTPPQ